MKFKIGIITAIIVGVSIIAGTMYSTPKSISTAISKDYKQLSVSKNNSFVGQIGGGFPEQIVVGHSARFWYIDRKDTELIQRFEQARNNKSIVAVRANGSRYGKARIVKIGTPTDKEIKAYQEIMNSSINENYSSNSFYGCIGLANAFNHSDSLSCSITNMTGCILLIDMVDDCYVNANALQRAIENIDESKICQRNFVFDGLVSSEISPYY